MQNKLNNQEKNDRVNVGKINNGTCVVLLNIMQRFSDKTNPLETLQPLEDLVVENTGLEPATSYVRGKRSPRLS